MTAIIGIRYKGKKEPFEDIVLKSGATWQARGDIVNFTSALGAILIKKHPDVFEEARPDYDASIVLSVPNMPTPRPIVMLSMANADAQQIVNFARMHYSKFLDVAKPVDVLRLELFHAMDAATHVANPTLERFVVSYPLSAEEYAAYMEGGAELRLVPVAPRHVLESDAEASGKNNAQVMETCVQPVTSVLAAPLLEDLLAAMNEDELRAFAESEQIKVHHNAGKEKLREVIASAIRTREMTSGASVGSDGGVPI